MDLVRRLTGHRIDAVAQIALYRPRFFGDPMFAKRPLRVRRQFREHHLLDVLTVQWRAVRAFDSPVDPECGRFARDEQEIAGRPIGDDLQPRVEPPRRAADFRPRRIELGHQPVEIVSR